MVPAAANPDPMLELAIAIESNDADRVRTTLSLSPHLKARLNEPLPNSGFGSTPLLRAVELRNRVMIDHLLQAGADIHARSRWWAGSFGVLDQEHGLNEFLIERGATIDVHVAARLGRLERLKELVEAQPELVHARGGDGQTPLHFACSIEVVDFLLAHGARIDARDIDHESTAAQYMVRDRTDVAHFLVSRGSPTDLLLVAALGDVDRARAWLDADPKLIQMRVSERWFPKRNFHSGGCIYIWTLGQNKSAHTVAREFGHEAVLNLLLERSSLPMRLACAGEAGDGPTVHALLATHPDLVRELTGEDQRLVAHAAQQNNTKAVRVMLEAGWPVDARGQHGGTALHWAAWHGNATLVRLLLQHRASLELKDSTYQGTPLVWARHGSQNSWFRQTGDYGQVIAAIEAGHAS